MNKFGRFVANALIISVISIFLYDIFLHKEHWPFSSHRMYSGLISPTYVRDEVVMVTPEGEVPMDVNVHLKPFNKSQLTHLLRLLVQVQNRRIGIRGSHSLARLFRRKLQNLSFTEQTLTSLVRVYKKNRSKHGDQWPQMIGLKVYRLQWQLDPELENLDNPQKTLRFSFMFQ